MDRHTVVLFIPIAALAIPTVAIIMNGMLKLARLRVEEAKLHAGDAGNGGDVAALRDEVAELRHELGEVHERLDFAERMLARGRGEGGLPQA